MTSHTNAVELTPTAPSERIHALDLLRGWALFGVLWSNLNDWYGARASTDLERGFVVAQQWFISSRFYTLLCLLFGIGFGIQLLRAAERGTDVRTVFYRRTLALLGIGVVHATLIWSGDILSIYAMVAFALVMFRTLSPRRLLVAALLCWFVAPYIITRVFYITGLRVPISTLATDPPAHVLAGGSWLEIAPLRVAMYFDILGRWGLTVFFFSVLALFLVGLWSVKSGYLYRVIEDARATRRLLLVALAAAVVGYAWNILSPGFVPQGFVSLGDGPGDLQFWIPSRMLVSLLNWSTEGAAIAYAAILLLLWQRPAIARILQPLAATGRIALTTYLVQSIVCTMLFYGYGFGLYGAVGFTGMFTITLALFAVQMVASTWWLARFHFGPAEWLWRTLTYGRAPAMRIARAPASAVTLTQTQ